MEVTDIFQGTNRDRAIAMVVTFITLDVAHQFYLQAQLQRLFDRCAAGFFDHWQVGSFYTLEFIITERVDLSDDKYVGTRKYFLNMISILL